MPYCRLGWVSETIFVGREDEVFERVLQPDEKVPVPGIYKCDTCGFEVISTGREGDRLPPGLRCVEHATAWKVSLGSQAVARWRLVATPIR